MPNRALLIGIAALWAAGPAVGVVQTSHCGADEIVIFSCGVERSGKVVSLCASDPFDARASLSYRFGPRDGLELVFPGAGREAGSLQRFRLAHYIRYRTDRTEVSFDRRGHTYTVYQYFDEDTQPLWQAGVRVTAQRADTPGGRAVDVDLPCSSEPESALHLLHDRLPCDSDNPLAFCP